MRFHLLGLVLLAGTAAGASAQTNAIVQPEISAARPTQTIGGIPASSAVADLTARVDALEAQLARLTGQAEENAYRMRQLDEQLTRLRSEAEARERLAAAGQPAELAAAEPERPAAVETAAVATPPASGDEGEDAYIVGFRQWEGKQFAQAQKTLEAMAKKYPKHRRASYALNLAGRAYLDDGKPATAAKLLLSNYQVNPKGERAADSLYFLGQALVALKKPAEACKVYDELREIYPDMRDWVRQRLPKARTDAKCGA